MLTFQISLSPYSKILFFKSSHTMWGDNRRICGSKFILKTVHSKGNILLKIKKKKILVTNSDF